MPSRICEPCDVRLPMDALQCPACEKYTRYYAAKNPDPDWLYRVTEAKKALAAPAPRRIPFVDIGAVSDQDGRLWLYRRDLIQAGYLGEVDAFGLFELRSGVIVECQGFDRPRGRWWVDVIGKSDGGY